jgi:acyl CoA:acetate/3-ketoacid CoA transferase beta subunit
VFLIMPLSRRAFVDQIDFCTSPGHLPKDGRAALGLPGAGPKLVVTDKAIFHFEEGSGEMVLSSVHPGVTVDEVRAEVGWPLKVASGAPATTKPPTPEELRLIREELDPGGAYTRR